MDNLTIETMMPQIQELATACEFIKSSVESERILDNLYSKNNPDITNIINSIFNGKCVCTNTIITFNCDKPFFGVLVNPDISNVDLLDILLNDNEKSLNRFSLEIDSKVISILDPTALAEYIIHDIMAITSTDAITRLRAYIDTLLGNNEDTIDLKNSINYSNILIYGIKYTLRKITNLIQITDEELKSWPALRDVRETIFCNVPGISHELEAPKMSLLEWCFMIYKNISGEYRNATEVLSNAKLLTGSKLEVSEIERLISSINRASVETVTENSVYESVKNNNTVLKEQYLAEKFSLFANLKKNGLKGIENDLYEFKVRVKNCTTQDDAIFILRGMSTRMTILDDYMQNDNISDYERSHWQSVMDQYRALRLELGSKKFESPRKAFDNLINIDYSIYDKLD